MRRWLAMAGVVVGLAAGCGGGADTAPDGQASSLLAAGGAGSTAAFRLAQWNVKKGYGKAGWAGSCAFRVGADCSANAWGSGVLQRTLTEKIGNDPSIVALALSEAQYCATPRRIQALLGWAAVAPATTTGEVEGTGVVARHGLAGEPAVTALPGCAGSPYRRYVVHAPVYADDARTTVVNVYAAHWSGCAAEADTTLELMRRNAGTPRVLLGDLNALPDGPAVARLTEKDYADAWGRLQQTGGYTSTYNNRAGSPEGSLYKRIDYAFSKGVTPVSVTRFNHAGTAGRCVQSDHAGLVTGFAH